MNFGLRIYVFRRWGIIFAAMAFLSLDGLQSVDAQWYQTPVGGRVTFTFTERWGLAKGLLNQLPIGDASLTIGMQDGSRQTIWFTGSEEDLHRMAGVQDQFYNGRYGTNVWTQTVSLAPGSIFAIVSRTPAVSFVPGLVISGSLGPGTTVLGLSGNVTTNAPLINPPPANPIPTATPPPPTRSNIHALIISGRSDPTKIVTSQNVTLVGGVVALGKDSSAPSAPNPWSAGLHIVPDEALLTGAKIPPLTPNIIDVRIVKHELVGDLAEPGVSPSP
jgi:hypothetical protein